MSQEYDVIVIGSGPGGYVCAIRAAQLGLKTACIEKDDSLGGTCLNVGCIPSKALLHASHKFEEAGHELKKLGVEVGTPKLNLKAMMDHKESVVKDNTQGIKFLFKKNKVDHVVGHGRIQSADTVIVTGKDGKETELKTKSIVIATGSEVSTLPGIEIDGEKIVTSDDAIDLKEVPKKLVVIGGGIIGLEIGSVWNRLGSEVTVVEYMDKILVEMDQDIQREMKKIFEKQGMKFKLSSKVVSAEKNKKGVTLKVEPAQGGDAEELNADVVLMSVGRKPYTKGLGLEDAGVKMAERGMIDVDDNFETNVKGIYAIGDVIRGPMLAHKAEDEGVVVAEILAGETGHIDYNAIPGVVYTHPEVASIGRTEQQLKSDGVAYNVGKFPFMANGRARAMNMTEGFVKILSDKKTDRVLGCHIIGAEAGTLIAEIGLALEFGASSEDIARTCHAHPTLNEVVKEAALAADGRAIHM
tara:strand:- start:128 stop:1534 length:1407 start_codon:yes stop_codon:yes gene_type:complete